jgi:hypothetical protein
MSDSTSIIATLLLTSNQSAKEAAANRLFNAATPAMLFALNALTTTGLTFGLIGGRYLSGAIANQTVALTDNADNYIVATVAAGVVSVATSTTNWNDQTTYVRLYKVVTVSGAITSYEDHRASIVAVGVAGGTNLSYTAATRVLASDTGTDATLPLVTTGDAGLAPASGGGTSNFLRADGTWTAPAGTGGDASTNTSSSVDSEIALFSSTGGKTLKRATGTGYAKVTSGVLSADTTATVATDLQGSGLTAGSVGFREIPQNSQSAAYTTVAADSGKHIFHPSADTTARTWTIDSNANVAYPIGTAITFINQNAGGVITIAITSDTMRLAGAGTTGSRTLAANGIATAVKVTSTEWLINGTGLT